VTVVVVTALAGTGYGWVGALRSPGKALTWTSVTTDLGRITGWIGEGLDLTTEAQMLNVWRYAGLAAAGVFCVLMLRRYRTNLTGVGLGLTAVVLLSPVVHPWYTLWATVPLAAAATGAASRKLVIVSTLVWTMLVFPGGVAPDFDTILGIFVAVALLIGAWAMGVPDAVGGPRARLALARERLVPSVAAQRLRSGFEELSAPHPRPPTSDRLPGARRAAAEPVTTVRS
jgi:hypothetical protein